MLAGFLERARFGFIIFENVGKAFACQDTRVRAIPRGINRFNPLVVMFFAGEAKHRSPPPWHIR